MNVVALSEARGGAVIAGTEGPPVLPGAGEGLLLGIRPEHVRLSDSFGVPASVLAAEYLGADTVVTCKAGSEMIAARLEGRVPLQAGAAVRVAWPPESIHLFDRASGRRHEGAAPQARMTQ
jgi:sn-glycerol 3-phosphate transport system ATP-binding protein